MTLPQAQIYASHIVTWLNRFMLQVEVAGSIRRERPECGDVDIICVPLIIETKDMFGEVIKHENALQAFLQNHVRIPASGASIRTCGERQMIIELKKCQLDLWFADEKTFATRLMCRTGSKEHNVWLASRAKRQGKKWNPYEGILYGGKWFATASDPGPIDHSADQYVGGQLVQFATEADLYASLDLPFIEPQNRELEYLVKNFGQ